ncbi:hypothetical protein BjapCC829_23100 [Bradyrhizobium barranii]|uniref:Uncharacterized protein n=1 Tax=Bradyrhizobium barranii TaxID=2992140 RepID=A0ABY3QAH0_9BRAD|nr:hypothetical protein [Bradyrhizobium japonicum]UFW82879.1 hypothetical protein BjapCC829_23100 [Bradyrhizobium japonicum]
MKKKKDGRAELRGLIAKLDAVCKADVAKHRKPASRSARLREAEAHVKAAKPRDQRLVWKEME